MRPMRTVKRGANFYLRGIRTRDGLPVDLSTMTVTARLVRIVDEDGQKLDPDTSQTYTLTVTKDPSVLGAFDLTATSAATASWLVGIYASDVQFSVSGFVANSATYYVNVERDYTP